MISRFRTFIAGFLVLLPLTVTVAVIVWVGTFIYAYLGPGSAIGRILISIGFNFSNSPIAAYALGAVVVVRLVYLLGLVVESRLESQVRQLIDSLMQHSGAAVPCSDGRRCPAAQHAAASARCATP